MQTFDNEDALRQLTKLQNRNALQYSGRP